MTDPAATVSTSPVPADDSAFILPAEPSDGDQGYGRPFWLAYISNTLLMVAISLLFRYADLVQYLGGDEWQLGWIVGVGMVGSLLTRLALGVGIDRYGPRRIWIVSTCLFAVACLGHLLVVRIDGPLIYALRILHQSCVAGFFGASITFVSRRAAVHRIAEVVGALGTSGFLGMTIGPILGDLVCGPGPVPRERLVMLFSLAGGLSLGSAAFGAWATRGESPAEHHHQHSMWALLKRHHPGALLLVSAAMGFGLGMPGVFLRTYAAEIGIPRISWFFLVYMPVAFSTRMLVRKLHQRLGIAPMIDIGMAAMVLGTLAYLAVSSEAMLVAPAVFLAVAHALIFPAVIAGAAVEFPERHRGLGMTLILALMDVGTLLGAPLVGGLLLAARRFGWPPYPTMFSTVAAVMMAVLLIYAASRPRRANAPP